MLDQRRAATRPEERREQLFTERYESLLAWAMRLTSDRAAAEDLVQDAFVQFMLGRTGLEQIENIDGYLRRMLRYMHSSRMSRQAQRLQDTALSVADTTRSVWAGRQLNPRAACRPWKSCNRSAPTFVRERNRRAPAACSSFVTFMIICRRR